MKYQYKIKADTNLMKLLSTGIYKHKEFAVIRELSTNALDAVNDNDGVVELEIKNIGKKYFFIVRDTGTGLTCDETINLMSTYGNSTKTGNEHVTGMFGIGSKSPFAYTNVFFIKSIKDGEVNFFKCSKDANAIPMIELLKTEHDNDLQSGLEYRIPIREDSLSVFINNSLWFVYSQIENTKISFKIITENMNIKNTGDDDNNLYSNIESINFAVKPSAKFLPEVNSILVNSINIYNLIDDYKSNVVFKDDNIAYRFGYSIARQIKKQPAYKVDFDSHANNNFFTIRIGRVDYKINKENVNSVAPFRKNLIYVFNPKEIQVTGSRENIEMTETNINVINERLCQIVENIKSFIDPDLSWVNALSRNTKQAKMLKEIEDTIKINPQNDDYLSTLVLNPLDKLFMKTLQINNSNEIYLIVNNIDDAFKQINRDNDRSISINYLHFQENSKHIFCEFTRNNIDLELLRKDNPSAELYFLKSNKDIKSLMLFKRLKGYINSLDSFKNNITFIPLEYKNQYKRKYSKSANKTVEVKPFTYDYSYKKSSWILSEKDDKEKLKLYVYKHRNDYVPVSKISGSKYTVINNTMYYTDNVVYNKNLNTSLLGAEYIQLQAFSNKKSFETYLKKNSLEYSLEDVITQVVQKTVDKDRVARHYFKMIHDKYINRKLFTSRFNTLNSIFAKYCGITYDTYKYNIYNDICDCTNHYQQKIFDSINFEDIDDELLNKMKTFVKFTNRVYQLFVNYNLEGDLLKKTFELFKAIYINKTISKEYDIFEIKDLT